MSTKIRRDASFKGDEDKKCYVEIMLDVYDDSVSIHNIKRGGDPKMALLVGRLELRPWLLGAQLSFRLGQVSQELRRITSTKGCNKQIDRTKSGTAWALGGLHFMTLTSRSIKVD
ncbi:hypothetical protein NL676_025208 [Syzygium grande]|nr:hypothetical protein NL676_025208 [Syzygium grande]